MSLPDVSEAIVMYIGKGEEKFPRARTEKVVDHFGPRAPELVSDVQRFVHETGSIPYPESMDAGEAFRAVRELISAQYPELTHEAVAALAWKWAWDNR